MHVITPVYDYIFDIASQRKKCSRYGIYGGLIFNARCGVPKCYDPVLPIISKFHFYIL